MKAVATASGADGVPFSIGGVAFEAMRVLVPIPHWVAKLMETGQTIQAGVFNSASKPKLVSSIEDLAKRAGSEMEFRRHLGLPPAVGETGAEEDTRKAFEHLGRVIYPTKVFPSGARWAVQAEENRGSARRFGDLLFETDEAAKIEVERDAAARHRAAAAAQERADQDAVAKVDRQTLRGDLDQFLRVMIARDRPRADEALCRSIRLNSEPMMRFQAIRKMVEAGAVVRGLNGKLALRLPADVLGGALYTQTDITKLGLDFAEFLIVRRAKTAAQSAPSA